MMLLREQARSEEHLKALEVANDEADSAREAAWSALLFFINHNI